MKSLSKKAIVISIVTLITVPSVAFAGWSYTHHANKQEVKNTVASQEVNTQHSAPIAEDTATTPTPTIEPTPAPIVVTPVPAHAPVILSTQEYANMYLNMTKRTNERYTPQECLDSMINLWPNRFSETVREANIKALRFFERNGGSICTSSIYEITHNILNPPYTTKITGWGQNGEFFDGDIAKQYMY